MRPKKNKEKRLEGNVVIFEDLSIYNSYLEKDKKINDELKSFLKSKGYVPARIKTEVKMFLQNKCLQLVLFICVQCS